MKNQIHHKLLAILMVLCCTLYSKVVNAQLEDIYVSSTHIRTENQTDNNLKSCETATIETSFMFMGPLDVGYNNAMHGSSMALALPRILYPRLPQDPVGGEVNNETDFNLQMTITSSDGNVYWEEPYIESDHSLRFYLKADAVIPFGTEIYWNVTGLEIDDGGSYNDDFFAMIQHQLTDGNNSNDVLIQPFSTVQSSDCQSLLCVPNLFLSQNGQLYDIDISTNPFTFPEIGSNYGSQHNGMGFNPLDGYLYAMLGGTPNNLLKIHPQTGEVVNLGAITNSLSGSPLTGGFANGDFDENGVYYIKGTNANGLYAVNVVDLTATPIVFQPNANTPSSDFAYNIKDGLLYATRTIAGQGTQLYTINPITGEVQNVGVPHMPGVVFGAMFGDSEGRIFGSANGGGFYQFNTTIGSKTLISDSPGSNNNDGAHCVLSPISFTADLYVTKTDGSDNYIPGSTITYTIEAGNSGPFGVQGATVSDLVPEGIPEANVSYTATVSGDAVTSVSGTMIGNLNDVVDLPVGDKIAYIIKVKVPEDYTGNLVNTVTITAPTSTVDIDLSNNVAEDINIPVITCPTGDCNENAFLFTSDPNTIEYDNLISGYHSTIAKQSDGNYLIWGQGAKPNTYGEHLYEPTLITPENGFNYTGKILKATLGTRGSSNPGYDQYAIITTDGLYIWGGGDPSINGVLVHTSVKNTQTFDKITNTNIVNANEYGLPADVTPEQVKMLFGSFATLAITTCNGEAYILSFGGTKNGDGTNDNNSQANIWHRVFIALSDPSDPAQPLEVEPLEGVVAMRGRNGAMMALTQKGEIFTWGTDTYLGDGSDKEVRYYATKMTLPTGVTPKMIGMTNASERGNYNMNSYYLLSTEGELFSLGDNSKKQLGTFDMVEQKSWVNVKSTNASTNMTDIVWISPNEHGARGYATITALTSDGKLWGWGENERNMLGAGTNIGVDPRYMFGDLSPDDKILAIETGGHINTILKDCNNHLGYIGHNSNGSYGVYATSLGNTIDVFKFEGAKLSNLCAIPIPPTPEVMDLKTCSGQTVDLQNALQNNIPAGYSLQWWTTPDRQTGTQVADPTNADAGTYYAFYTSDSAECSSIEGVSVEVSNYTSTDPEFSSCACFREPILDGTSVETKVGVSVLRKSTKSGWPEVRKGGFIALESNNLGMVVTRIAKENLSNIIAPQEGMMVYDTTDKCLKIYSDNEWKCFNTPTCGTDNDNPEDLTKFTYRYGGSSSDTSYSVYLHPNGGYIVLGNTYSTNSGDVTFTNPYLQGGSPWFLTLDEEGNRNVSKAIAPSTGSYMSISMNKLAPTSDGNFIGAGYTVQDFLSGNSNVREGFLVKLDKDGNKIWEKKYRYATGNDRNEFTSAKETPDGGFIVLGKIFYLTPTSKPDEFWVMKTDSQGNKVWEKTFATSGHESGNLNGAGEIFVEDDGYVFVAIDKGLNPVVRKIDLNGNLIWNTSFPDSLGNNYHYLFPTADGYVYGGNSNSDAYLAKLDTNGNIVTSKTFGGSGSESLYGITPTADGGIAFVANTNSSADGDVTETNNGSMDLWVVKLDQNLNLQWEKLYGGIGSESGYNGQPIVQTAAGGYAIVAYSAHASAGTGDQANLISRGGVDIWFLKLDSNGNLE